MADSPNAKKLSPGDPETVRVPLAEEEVRISKREVTTGTVQVRTEVDVREEVSETTLNEEVVEVTRVPRGPGRARGSHPGHRHRQRPDLTRTTLCARALAPALCFSP